MMYLLYTLLIHKEYKENHKCDEKLLNFYVRLCFNVLYGEFSRFTVVFIDGHRGIAGWEWNGKLVVNITIMFS